VRSGANARPRSSTHDIVPLEECVRISNACADPAGTGGYRARGDRGYASASLPSGSMGYRHRCYEPEGRIARGADRKETASFLLHAASGDASRCSVIGRIFSRKSRFAKVVAFTFRAGTCFDNRAAELRTTTPSMPTARRVPIWQIVAHAITDQYERADAPSASAMGNARSPAQGPARAFTMYGGMRSRSEEALKEAAGGNSRPDEFSS